MTHVPDCIMSIPTSSNSNCLAHSPSAVQWTSGLIVLLLPLISPQVRIVVALLVLPGQGLLASGVPLLEIFLHPLANGSGFTHKSILDYYKLLSSKTNHGFSQDGL